MDVRQSDIDSLEERVKKLAYERYLPSLRMINVRSFQNQQINFDFPVTAVIGTNGGGKSTVLGAAALAYKANKPGDFFPKSNIGDNSMADWKIEYNAIDRSVNKSGLVNRSARFVAAKWRRDDVLSRQVVVIPIQRTVPANEQARFKHFIGLAKKKGIVSTPIDASIAAHVGRILGKDASGYARVSLKSEPSKAILVGVKHKNDYSQFHFGAGEASIIGMVSQIEDAEPNALILIEEIENGLHPLATKKMVEYLFDVAKRKKVQVIYTTHSEYALDLLPPKAIWGCIDGTAYQGKLTIESLRALTGSVTKERAIFVEDDFAKDFCNEIVRQYAPDLLEQTEIHKAGGFPYVVEVLKHHNSNPTIKHKAVAVIDGDNPPLPEPNDHVLELPDGAPEAVIFGYALENADSIAALVKQRCQCPSKTQDEIVAAMKAVSVDTTDHHLYFSKLGDKLGFISELVIRRGLASIYVENAKKSLAPLVEQIKAKLLE